MKRFVALVVVGCCLAGCQSPNGSDPPLANVHDLEGHAVNPFANSQSKATALIFIRTDCPISNRYAPEIERLKTKYAPEVTFWLVYPDPDVTSQQIRDHVKEFSLSVAPIQDPQHQLVHKAAATVTPEAAVFLPDGVEIYRGRIDDRFVDFGKARPAATQHDLDSILQAVVAGKAVAKTRTQAIGCYISD